MKNMLKLGLIMAVYATLACVALAFVYTGTQKVIAERQTADLEAALKELFPDADGFKEITDTLKNGDPSVAFKNGYAVTRNGEIIGVAVRSVGASYGGPITVLIGVDTENRISGVKVTENKDTPGLGANAANPTYFVDRKEKKTFTDQFKHKALGDAFEVKGDVIAITASTITSKAVANLVKVTGRVAAEWLSAQKEGTK